MVRCTFLTKNLQRKLSQNPKQAHKHQQNPQSSSPWNSSQQTPDTKYFVSDKWILVHHLALFRSHHLLNPWMPFFTPSIRFFSTFFLSFFPPPMLKRFPGPAFNMRSYSPIPVHGHIFFPLPRLIDKIGSLSSFSYFSGKKRLQDPTTD